MSFVPVGEDRGFIIKDKVYFIDYFRKSDGRNERVRLRKSSKLLCCERCFLPIAKGDVYIRDEFYYRCDAYHSHGWKRVNFVCLKCWGDRKTPSLVSTNR